MRQTAWAGHVRPAAARASRSGRTDPGSMVRCVWYGMRGRYQSKTRLNSPTGSLWMFARRLTRGNSCRPYTIIAAETWPLGSPPASRLASIARSIRSSRSSPTLDSNASDISLTTWEPTSEFPVAM